MIYSILTRKLAFSPLNLNAFRLFSSIRPLGPKNKCPEFQV